ncbi:hypothetical protein HOLleu_01410 [Holothuria leucospilota]|uniref:Ig-like domain-containing protein n=1 Tax=Holothuria leucospilota TaxID=206669 RepID=A0A9Q1CPX2_HOLLE|nr:hypothetical protein HOLleu_01410 [Holothuria leucospilota]
MFFMICMISVIFHHGGAEGNFGCPSGVYLEYKEAFVIACNFRPNFESVFWYKVPNQGPFISYQNGVKFGTGYNSGEFDVATDGSLVIHNVTLDFDGQLRVFVHYQQWENDVRQTVDLTVYVKAHQDFPHINVCKDKPYCHVTVDGNRVITCSVNKTRPAAELNWFKRYAGSYSILPSDKYETTAGLAVSSFASVNVTITERHLLEVIVCRSSSRAPIMTQNHSMILIERNVDNYSSKLPITRLSKVNDNVYLGFDNDDVYAAVWKKRLPTGIYHTIGYFFYGVSELYDVTFEISNKAELGIERFQLENEGKYLVVYASPTSQGYKQFQVHLFVAPNPPVPKIFGCLDEQNCVLQIASNGRLECSLEGIRPLVHLEWIFNGEGISPITFSSPLLSVVNRGVTYDSSVTTSFLMKPETRINYIEVACQVADQIDGLSTMRSNITLYYAPEYMDITQKENCENYFRIGKIFLIVGTTLTSVMILLCCCCACVRCLED